MFGTAWLTLRQAREALRTDRLDEATRLLAQPAARGHRRAFALQEQVLRAYIDRSERHLRTDFPDKAWLDLLNAEAIRPTHPSVENLRKQLTSLGLAEVRAILEAGDPERARQAIARLRDRSVSRAQLSNLEEAAREWEQAQQSAERGEFGVAIQTLEVVGRRLPPPTPGLDRYQSQLTQRHEVFSRQLVQLHEAMDARRWREVVTLADQMLALAPLFAEARQARSEAWRAIQPLDETLLAGETKEASPPPADPVGPPRRLFLWIDGVGGYLVCLMPRVTLGQATADAPVDVPLFADVSRLHATLSRDAEGYLLEAAKAVLVNGKPATRTALKAGDRVTLGSSCQVAFQVPVPVSNSARLEVVSGHRLPAGVSAVLLMADTLVLGPGTNVHVPVPELKENVVLYRQKDGLGVRFPGEFRIDGQRCKDRATMGVQAAVSGPDFAFAVEPAPRLS